MCIYVCVYIYICIYRERCICYIYIYIYTCIYMYLSLSLSLYIYIYMYCLWMAVSGVPSPRRIANLLRSPFRSGRWQSSRFVRVILAQGPC